MKNYIFTIDDNIRFLKELTEQNAKSLFSHPYAHMLKCLHEEFGVKIQLNLFYECPDFNLSQMTDKYRAEWAQNADWLKLSFHSRLENIAPYEHSDYQEVYGDCAQVQREILRFAGVESLAKTTTIHYCLTTNAGVQALKDNGVQGLLGLYGSADEPRLSYNSSKEDGMKIRDGAILQSDGVAFAAIDVVLNCFTKEENLEKLQALQARNCVKVMIHEQYFYQDYAWYQPDFKEKLSAVFAFFQEQQFSSCFFEELLGE